MEFPFKKAQIKISPERSALLVSIGISLLIWVFLKLSKVYDTESTIAIEYTLPPLMEFTDSPPSSLVAVVSGPGIDLAKKFLFQRKHIISIDLALLPDPAVQRSELISKIQEETGLVVKDINRNYLSFSIDSTATKKVPVILNVSLVFKKDFFQNLPVLPSPDSVILAGPIHELQLIDSVETEMVSITNINGYRAQAILIKKDGFKNITVHPAVITVEVSAEQFTEKTMEVPILAINAPAGTQLNPKTVNVSCSVGLSKYQTLTPDSFTVEVDLAQGVQPEGQKSVPVYLKYSPLWVKAPRVFPKVVDFLQID